MKTKFNASNVILSAAKDLRLRISRSFAVSAAQDDVLAALVLGLVLLGAACQRSTLAQETTSQTPPNEVWVTAKQIREASIATDVVAERPVGNTLATTGRVTFSDSRVAHVFSPVTGRVTNVLTALGAHVQRGTALAVIASPDISSAASDLQKADADLAAAQRDYERQKDLYEHHAAAQRDFEAAESNYRKAKAERERAAQKSALLGNGTGDYILRAPIDGDVVARNVNLGIEVQGQYSGGNAAELFTIGNLDSVWVLADVFEVDLARVHAGAPVTINVVTWPDRVFRGRIDWISGALDPATRAAKVRCAIDNREHLLRPEMFATVTITTDARPKLAVPRSAVVRVGDQMVAFVDKGKAANGEERFERRIVAIDESEAGDYAPVLRGLASGERVVSSGAIILSGSGA